MVERTYEEKKMIEQISKLGEYLVKHAEEIVGMSGTTESIEVRAEFCTDDIKMYIGPKITIVKRWDTEKIL